MQTHTPSKLISFKTENPKIEEVQRKFEYN